MNLWKIKTHFTIINTFQIDALTNELKLDS